MPGANLEQPVLRLGLLGFSDEMSARLRDWAEHSLPGWPAWCIDDPHRADAWLIDGRAVVVLNRDALTIQHPAGGSDRWTLHRAEVDRPLAFSLPLPEGFASAESFDAADEQSLRQRLQRFEAWLRPLRSQFALGSQLVRRLPEYQGDVVHLMHDGRLLGVLDFPRWQCGLLIPARPVDLVNAEWVRRPAAANDIPAAFLRLKLHQVMWAYAVRTRLDILPERYRERVIHMRRVPHLPARWFDPAHLLIMQELSVRPATLAQLQQRTSLDLSALASRVAALYFAAGLTTDEDSGRRAESAVRRALLALQLGPGDRVRDSASRDTQPSDWMGPSSILREALHSPLRMESSGQRHNVGKGQGPE
jgi:hypothetical protein